MASAQEQESSLPPPQNHGPGLLAEYYILWSIALILVLLRIYGRVWLTKQWGWDDTTIVIAWIFLLIGLVLIQITVDFGLGRHIFYLPNPERNALDVLKYNTFFQMDNVVVTLMTKISISLYILRIRNDKHLRWILGILMVFMTLATIATIAVLGISCIPLRKLWTPEIPGKCLPLSTVYNVAYVQSGFTIVTDLCLTSAPVIILWNVNIRRGRKIFICFLMSLGLVATISNALRNAFQPGLTDTDFTYDQTSVSVVAILELNSGIIAACIPTCVGIFRKRQTKMELSAAYHHSSGMLSGKQTTKSTLDSFNGRNYSTLEGEDRAELLPIAPTQAVVTGV